MKIIDKWIVREYTNSNSLTSSQLKILDIEEGSLKARWFKNFQPVKVSDARFELFKRLKGIQGKRAQILVIEEFKRELNQKNTQSLLG
jgi:hypothetical protein